MKILALGISKGDTVQIVGEGDKAEEIEEKLALCLVVAKGQNLPYISGLPRDIFELENGTKILMDGKTGDLFTEPTEELIEKYESKDKREVEIKAIHDSMKFSRGKSKDGIDRKASTNIAGLDDMELVLESGAEGIALFRT